ncbi:MAG: CaiB/BaiF CoA transferase family protein [Hyphomicrobiales bacterium]
MKEAEPPLKGRMVLELGELLAGPFIGTLLGEFGAEVVKIERPGGGDVLRQFGPIVNGESLYWQANSRNKKSVVLDLQKEKARDILRELIGQADVLVNSLRPGTLEKWALDEESLYRLRPELIVVHASAFGRGAPYSDRGGYDPIAQGYSGLSHVTGEADGPPMRAGGAIPVCDFMTGLAGALGAVLSLYSRDARGGGRGQVVDVALYDVAFRMLGPLLGYFDLTGHVWQRDGNHSLGGAPTGHFKTADNHWICTSVQNNEQFARLARLIGHPEWLQDERFVNLKSRTRHRDAIEEVVSHWIASRPRHEVIEAFSGQGLGLGPINSVADLSQDVHLARRGSYWTEHPAIGRYRMPDVVPRLAGTPGTVRHAAPRLGEDTFAVLQQLLGYSESDCIGLEQVGVIARPSEKLSEAAV